MYYRRESPKTIFILDNYRQIRLLLADEFTELGYRVITSGDDIAIMQKIEKSRPDLIVMEIGLGDRNGLDLLQEIRDRHYDLPVILWTSYYDSRHDPRVLAADYFVLKRTDIEELKSKVGMALEGCRPFKALNGNPVWNSRPDTRSHNHLL